MSWLVTVFMSGILFSIGWRFGKVIFEWIYEFIMEIPYGIRKMRRYRKKRNNQRYITTKR